MIAKRIDAIRVNPVTVERETHLQTDCRDFDAYEALPDAVSYQGSPFVKTGWNSDSGTANYKPANRGTIAYAEL